MQNLINFKKVDENQMTWKFTMQSKWQNLYHSKAIHMVYWSYSQRNTLHKKKYVYFKNLQNLLTFRKVDEGHITIKFKMKSEWQNLYHLKAIYKIYWSYSQRNTLREKK